MIDSKNKDNKKFHLCFAPFFRFIGHSWDIIRGLSDLLGRFLIFDLKKVIYKKNEFEGLGSYHFYEESLISLRKVGVLFIFLWFGVMVSFFGFEALILFSLPLIILTFYLIFFHFKGILKLAAYLIFVVFFLFHKEREED